jgi:hypothetical protein
MANALNASSPTAIDIRPDSTGPAVQQPLTIDVPEAGKRYFDLSRAASYAAAARGEIPTIKIGRLLKVPVRALEQMLDKASSTQAA